MKLAERTMMKLDRKIAEQYVDRLSEAFKERFSADLVTIFNIIDMRYQSHIEGRDFTMEEVRFIGGFSAGYLAAQGALLYED